MKIFITIALVLLLALGVVGAVGFLSHGFESFDKSTVKEQLDSIKDSVENLTDRVKDAFTKKDKSEDNTDPADNDPTSDENNGDVATEPTIVQIEVTNHKNYFVDEGVIEGDVTLHVLYSDGKDAYVSPDELIGVDTTHEGCFTGYAHFGGQKCSFEYEVNPRPVVIDHISQLSMPTYNVGDVADPNAITVTVVFSNSTHEYVVCEELDVDTSVAGHFTGTAYYQGFSCDFEYDVVEEEHSGPTGSGEQMVEEDGEW